MPDPIHVLIVDDHEVFATSLARALSDEADFVVHDPVADEAGARAVLDGADHVDVVLSDVRLAESSGVDLARAVTAEFPHVAVVMLTASQDEAVMAAALDAGCAGFVTKTEPLATVVSAVRAAAAGESVVTPALLARLLRRVSGRDEGDSAQLTRRELEVLALVVEGGTNQQIADQLFVSRDTVRNHVASILSKLGVHSKLQAAAEAQRRGLVSPPRS